MFGAGIFLALLGGMLARTLLVGLAATLLLACGGRQRRVESQPTTVTRQRVTTYGSAATVVVVPQGTYYGQGPVVVVPQYEGGPAVEPPAPAPVQAPPPPAPAPEPAPQRVAYRGAVVHCSGNERIRVHNRHVTAEGGAPAIVATGNCVVEVSESIVRGAPAVVVEGNARVELVECRVFGDLVSGGNAHIGTRGTAHEEGRVVQARVRTAPRG